MVFVSPLWVLAGVLLALALMVVAFLWPRRRSDSGQGTVVGEDEQAQANRRIQQQHLADLDQALVDGRLDVQQHAQARDEWMRQVLAEVDRSPNTPVVAAVDQRARTAWVLVLVVLTAMTYAQLGARQTWHTPPLSQRVPIPTVTPEQAQAQIAQWTQHVATAPNDAHAWLSLARLHNSQNAHALAEQALARVVDLAPESDLWLERAQMRALSLGGDYSGEPWQWILAVLADEPQHLNALVLAGSAARSQQRFGDAQAYWQQALALVPPGSAAAQDLQQGLSQIAESASAGPAPAEPPASALLALIQGEVRVTPELQGQVAQGATLLVYALNMDGSRRPVSIFRSDSPSWPVRFVLSDSMGMGVPPLLSSLPQVRLVARLQTTAAPAQAERVWQVELDGVNTGVQGVVLQLGVEASVR
jgi:cytochrome c-type biogenesis protein CcmH